LAVDWCQQLSTIHFDFSAFENWTSCLWRPRHTFLFCRSWWR